MAEQQPSSPWLSLLFTAAIVGAGVIVLALLLDTTLKRYTILAPPDLQAGEVEGDDLAA